MSTFLETLYMFSGTVAIVAGSGQVRQLIKVGRSQEMSLFTWSLWLLTQIIGVAYAIAIKAVLIAIFNLMWALLYATVFVLIVYYRKYPRTPSVELADVSVAK